jgi:hypothetical protein
MDISNVKDFFDVSQVLTLFTSQWLILMNPFKAMPYPTPILSLTLTNV